MKLAAADKAPSIELVRAHFAAYLHLQATRHDDGTPKCTCTNRGRLLDAEAIVNKLVCAFPQETFDGEVAPHDCPTCHELQNQLTGATWPDVPDEFIRDRFDVLPLLSHAAYVAFLPAWLRQGILEPEGDVAGMLAVNLSYNPDTTGFSAQQREAVIEAARFIVQHNGWGPEDSNNLKDIAAIESAWA